MATKNPISEAVELQHAIITADVSVAANTPHPADIVDSDLPHRKYAIAVTEENGLQVEVLETDPQSIAEHPYRVTGERTVTDLDSFLAELARRPLGLSGTLWGNAQRGVLTAIYNDHYYGHTDDGVPAIDIAGWRDDKLNLTLTKDEDWSAWHALSDHYYGQQEFGDRIEALLHTVISPDQADLLEVIDSIRASTSGEFESGIERANGGQKLTYKQEHTVRAGRAGQLEVPQTITLELRPWEGHPDVYPVEAYFRVRIREGNLALAVKLKPTRQIVRAAWATLTNTVTEATSKPVYAVA